MKRALGSLKLIGYATSVLPFVTIHVTFFIGLFESYYDPCIPYWFDCVSISKTGREGSAYFVFKGGMILTGGLFVLFWHLNRLWLQSYAQAPGRAMIYLSVLGALALITYSLALGHVGDGFRMFRRFGVVLFIFCAFICQVIIGKRLSEINVLRIEGQRLLMLSAATLGIALFSLILDISLGDGYDHMENLFEWWLIVLLIIHMFCVAILWDQTGFRVIGEHTNRSHYHR